MLPPASLVLNGMTSTDLVERLAPLGINAELARRVFARVHDAASGTTIDELEVCGLSHRARDAIRESRACIHRLRVTDRHRSAHDGFKKYLFALHDGLTVEAVRIPLPAGPAVIAQHHVVCVSTQAGCALGCSFCATGKLGLQRNLTAWEIVEQVARIRDEAEAPVRGVVFMGMGEPFLNYDAVMTAAEILADPAGLAIGRKAMTISTAGIVPGILRFAQERRKHRLAISLASAIDEKRARLMPVASKYSIDDVLAAARFYSEQSHERVVIAYVMIRGENVGAEDADALIARLSPLRVRLNLIDVNDVSGRYCPPTDSERTLFRDRLRALRQPVVRRYSGGQDISAACGMLAAKHVPSLPSSSS